MARVRFCSDLLESEGALKAAIQPWADANGWDVGLYNAHGSTTHYRESQRNLEFQGCPTRIVFWANPVTTTSDCATKYREVFGRPLGAGQCDGVDPAEGYVGITDNTGNVVAQLSEDGYTLYVLFDLPHYGNEDRHTQYVMEQLLVKWDAALSRATPTMAVPDYREKLKVLLQAQLSTAITKKERELRDAKASQESYINGVVASTRDIGNISAMLNGLKSRPVDGASEYDKVLKCEKVKSVSVALSTITVETKEIPFTYAGNKYESGPYSIKINVGNGAIAVLGNNVHEGYVHPHVYASDGKPCFGNVGPGIYMLIGTFELAAAVAMIIQFLENCGESDWYIDPKKWAMAPTVAGAPTPNVELQTVPVEEQDEEEEPEDICEICDNADDDCTCWRCENCDRLRAEDAWKCDECGECERCCNGEHEHEYDHDCYCESCTDENHQNCACDVCTEFRHTRCRCEGCIERRNECECALHVEQRTYGNREAEATLPNMGTTAGAAVAIDN